MTLYLKYRSKNFSELDSESVRESLINIVGSKNIPHAFLFAGPKGTGKTSAARIFAKYLNCEELTKKGMSKKNFEPCNKCFQCISISKGENVDVIELDAASHRGIEDIRQLRETIKLSSARATKKVYIIDEAHMLTPEASNALLKTLEEPPSHVVLILATTNPEKLISTIRSRTTIIQFNKASDKEIVRSLKRICDAEKIKYDQNSLEIIAQNAGGSFRDAIKYLESVINQSGSINSQSVNKYLLNNTDFSVDVFVENLYQRDMQKSLDLIEKASNMGIGVKTLYEIIIKKFRQDLNDCVLLHPDTEKRDEIIELIKLFSSNYLGIQSEVVEHLGLEIAIIEWCLENEDILQEKNTAENNTSDLPKNPEKESINMQEISIKDNVAYQKTVVSKLSSVSDDMWFKILSLIRPKNASTEALLRAAKPVDFDGKKLTLAVFYSFHKEKLEISPHRMIIEEVVSSVVGCPVRVFCILSSPPEKSANNEDVKNKEEVHDEVLLTETENEDVVEAAEKMFSKGGVGISV